MGANEELRKKGKKVSKKKKKDEVENPTDE